MRWRVLQARLADARLRAGLSLLALFLLGAIVVRNNAASVSKQLAIAEKTRAEVHNDRDLHRMSRLLGPEVAIVEKIWRVYPAGTAISIPWPGDRFARRVMLGFWFALLPEYPVRAGGPLVICPDSQQRPGDRVIAQGRRFVLVERGGEP